MTPVNLRRSSDSWNDFQLTCVDLLTVGMTQSNKLWNFLYAWTTIGYLKQQAFMASCHQKLEFAQCDVDPAKTSRVVVPCDKIQK